MPVPPPDVLKCSLIVRRIRRVDGRLSGKLALRDSAQSVGLPRQVGVVDDVGLLANQLAQFDAAGHLGNEPFTPFIFRRAIVPVRDRGPR